MLYRTLVVKDEPRQMLSDEGKALHFPRCLSLGTQGQIQDMEELYLQAGLGLPRDP